MNERVSLSTWCRDCGEQVITEFDSVTHSAICPKCKSSNVSPHVNPLNFIPSDASPRTFFYAAVKYQKGGAGR